MDQNPRIVEIEEKQKELRKKAKESREKGDFNSYTILQSFANFLESDKLFISSPELLKVYRNIIKDADVEINGMKWPIDVSNRKFLLENTETGAREHSESGVSKLVFCPISVSWPGFFVCAVQGLIFLGNLV